MTSVTDIDTPALVIDQARALHNITTFQQHCDEAGLQLRPHIKTHKTIYFTRKQLDAGATGITCQKIGEAEIMADAGVQDILITYNIFGSAKLNRLKALLHKIESLSVTVDNLTVIEGISSVMAAEKKPLGALVECDTGAARCGVQTPEEALQLAQLIAGKPGLTFKGLMTYPAAGGAANSASFMKQTIKLLTQAGMDCPVVSTGGTPDMWSAATQAVFTEYRIGTYIYNDRSLIERGTCQEQDCAAQVHVTVVSTPTPERAVIDAGSKVLTSDLSGLTGYGYVVGHPDASIEKLSEEHGVLKINPAAGIIPGDRLRIIPNHVCVVSNMLDSVWLADDKGSATPLPVDARGRVL
ncbi:MAG: D-TA family PLP-dependent enzyme [Granulosicoccus sp.]|nr:D-TA family PLP-dependent enzyme [Granulosicoccus sp.]